MLSYSAPTSLSEALMLLAEPGPPALLVAGGIDVARASDPVALRDKRMVSLRRVPELRGLAGSRREGMRIGAMTTHRVLERSPDAAAYCAALTQACAAVGTVRIRNQGTIGGSLMQADPRYDPPAMLLALEATATLASLDERRTVPVDELSPIRTADAAPWLLVSVDLPPRPPSARSAYVKFVPSGAAEESTVTVAVAADFREDGSCKHARVWLGAVGDARVRLRAVEAALVGSHLTSATTAAAAASSVADVAELTARGRLDTYQQRLVGVCTRRALQRIDDEAAAGL